MGCDAGFEAFHRVDPMEDVQMHAQPPPALAVLACDPERQGPGVEMGDTRVEKGVGKRLLMVAAGGLQLFERLPAEHLELPAVTPFLQARLERGAQNPEGELLLGFPDLLPVERVVIVVQTGQPITNTEHVGAVGKSFRISLACTRHP